MNWSDYPDFARHEFECSETGECEMRPEFMHRLQALRTEYGAMMEINSGYRSKRHSIEAKKVKPGSHSTGRACDVRVAGSDAYRLVALALKHGFTRIGVNQKGSVSGRFIHLDDNPDFPNPVIWSY